MADQTRKQTDKILSRMEKEVSSIYKRANKEISEKWDKYMKSHENKLKTAYNALQEAIKSGNFEVISNAKAEYDRMVRNVTLNNERYKAMVAETTERIAHVNEIALDYVNDQMPKIYTINYNDLGNQEIAGYSFTLVNEQAIKNLAKEDKSLLPAKKLDIPKDKAWNTKSMNAEVLQGILQGEDITKIAKRLRNVTDMNRKSAIRNARTMTTGAENKGKQDSFKKAQSDGIILKRRWVATHDERTRAWHSDLDGVEVGINEAWENDYGSIMYPGDPAAHPGNVYNCRCAIRAVVKGFAWNQSEEEEEQSRYVPETLKSYDDVYKEFRDKRASQIGDMAPFEEMNGVLNDLLDNNEFRMRFPTDDASVLTSILQDGRFKTQFETGTTGGAYAPEKRKEASYNLFGTPEDINVGDYEKYGYLGSKDLTKDYNPQLGFYGDGLVTFKKDSLMDRTTLTVGDSLRDAADGRFIMGTKLTNIDSTVGVGRPSMIEEFLERVNKGIDKYGIENASMVGYQVRSYIELQYHGDLTLEDVSTITADKYVLDEVFKNRDLWDEVKRKGVKFNYIYNNEVMPYDIDN